MIKFLGDDLDTLEKTTNQMERVLESTPGAIEVTSSTKDNGTQFAITLDKEKATELGLNSTIIAQTLRSAISGITATKIKQGGKDIDVVVKAALNPNYSDVHSTNETNIESIRGLSIPTQNGKILLGSIMNVTLEKSNSVIRHEGRTRIQTIQSDVAVGHTAIDVTKEFQKRAEEIVLPAGVRMDIGGENEEVNKSFRDMFFALIAGLVLMLAILVLEFNSFRYPLFLLVTVPLSLIGVFTGLAITGQPVSFPSILGFIALSGVIINHAIILLDSIIHTIRRNVGMDLKEAIIESATVRLRPIFLTTVTTVVGVIPLSFASALWGPLAFSIMFGLSFAIILTLILVPLLFYRWPGNIEEENGSSS